MKNYFSLIILISALFAQNVVTESDSLNPIELEGVEIFSSLRQVFLLDMILLQSQFMVN